MSRRKSYGSRPEVESLSQRPKSPSAVSGAPRRNSGRMIAVKEALLIQRLEGSRPHGSLCTLNRSDRVQRSEEGAEIGMMLRFEDGMEQ